uniref:Uncharacterized protein n=1 Tax=Strigamia maritima TaxID=126957 RepID=T1IHR8_STRMM
MPSQQKRLQCGVSSTLDSSLWIKLAKGLDDFRFGPPSPYAGRILPASPAIIHELPESSTPSPSSTRSYLSITPRKELTSNMSTSSKVSMSVTTPEPSVFTGKSQTPTKKLQSRIKQKNTCKVFVKLMSILGPTPKSTSMESLASMSSTTEIKMSEDKIKLMQSRKLFTRKNVVKQRNTRGTPSSQVVEEAARHIVKGGEVTSDTLPRLFTDEFKKSNDEKPVESSASVLRLRRSSILDPYRSFLKRINYSGERTKRKVKKADVKLPEESETNVRQVAEDFCNWMQTIGGEDAKFTMDVDKVLTLFAMNAELESMQTTSNVLDEFPLTQDEADSLKKPKPSIASKISPKPVLPPAITKLDNEKANTEKKNFKHIDMEHGETLEDPEEIAAREKLEATRCSDELDTQLAELHTFQALTSFIRRNNLKVPNIFSVQWLGKHVCRHVDSSHVDHANLTLTHLALDQ